MTFRMTLRMTFKTWDFRGVFKGDFEVDLEVDLEGDFRGDFKQDLEGDLLSSSGQLRSRSGLVQVWFSIELKFDSFELDSEVGRLVYHLHLFFLINYYFHLSLPPCTFVEACKAARYSLLSLSCSETTSLSLSSSSESALLFFFRPFLFRDKGEPGLR